MLDKIRAASSKEELFVVVGALGQTGLGFTTKVDVYADEIDASTNAMYVSIPSLTLDQSYYDNATFAGIQSDYRKYISTIMRLSRYLDDDNSSSDIAENVIIDMQFELANATNVANADEEDQSHPIMVNDALDAYPLSFGQVAKGLGIVKNSSLIHEAKFIFSSLDAFDFIEDLISRKELEELKLYLAYVYVDASATRLSKEFYQAYFDFNGRALGGETTMPPRSSTCLTVETSNLPELIGKCYAQKMIDSTQDEDIHRMVRLIRTALRNHMNELTWLDGPTRKAAQGKLAKVDDMIGGPKKDMTYSYTLDSQAFFENVKTIALDSWATSVKKIGNRVDRSE
ncbi:hypothetical protein V7S43_011792 [Phytophthora oleae]|uniref:Peptidase M13 N-terminal domain-containing protein n=1 Tax=Phytophthora oleae TaxID=2107226 RepID=A0ABD3FAC2_9STRA